ncbi:MAG: chemotaxis protein [Gammaproteobacteria bacterium]|nr:chemotaxis protein [Gammaproteobacteria bacterium]
MLLKMFIAVAGILLLMMGWLVVQQLARAFAKRHPELGPLREEGQGCGSSCGCQGKGSCKKA